MLITAGDFENFKNMGKLPAALAVLAFVSLLSVIFFSMSSAIIAKSVRIRTQQFQRRDNLRYEVTDGNLRSPTTITASATKNSDSTSVASNTSSAVPSVSTASVASTPWHSVHSVNTDAGLAIHKLTNWSLERFAVTVQPTEPHFKGVGLKMLLQQTERNDSLTAEAPSRKQLTVSNSAATKCSDSFCFQYLSRSDRSYFSRCQKMARIDPSSDNKSAQCHFMDGRRRDPVALVSVPGAGNTWVRSLLEKATGICTGAIYCDIPIRKGGFIGEYVHSGSVIVVKTHTSDHQWKGERIEKRNHEDALYSSAILLIRSPFDTFVSERNRVITLRQLGGRAEHGMYAPVSQGKLDSSHVHALDREYFGKHACS